MRSLTLKQTTTISGTPKGALDSLRQRGHFAGAFGRSDAYESLGWIPLDSFAIFLNDTLAERYPRAEAAQIVRIHCDVWSAAVAMAEEHPDQPALFCVVDFYPGGKRAHLCCATTSTNLDEIAQRVAMTPQALGAIAKRISSVNATRLIKWLRGNAAKHGIDLSTPFLPPVNSPEFAEIFAPYVDVRDAAIATVKQRKAKAELAKMAGQRARAALEARLAGEDA